MGAIVSHGETEGKRNTISTALLGPPGSPVPSQATPHGAEGSCPVTPPHLPASNGEKPGGGPDMAREFIAGRRGLSPEKGFIPGDRVHLREKRPGATAPPVRGARGGPEMAPCRARAQRVMAAALREGEGTGREGSGCPAPSPPAGCGREGGRKERKGKERRRFRHGGAGLGGERRSGGAGKGRGGEGRGPAGWGWLCPCLHISLRKSLVETGWEAGLEVSPR